MSNDGNDVIINTNANAVVVKKGTGDNTLLKLSSSTTSLGNGSFSVGHNTISIGCNAGSADEIPIEESDVIGTKLVVNTIRQSGTNVALPSPNYVLMYDPDSSPKEATYSSDIPVHLDTIDVSLSLLDTSMNIHDVSLNLLDTSVNIIDASLNIHETSLNLLDTSMNIHDVSLNLLDTSVNIIDASLNIHETSLNLLDTSMNIHDASLNIHDASLNSLNLRVTNVESQGGGGASFGSTIAIGSGSTATGTNSVAIGNNASTSTYNNAVAIGNGSTAGADNTFILGDGTQNVGIGTSTPESNLHIATTTIGSDLKITSNTGDLNIGIWDKHVFFTNYSNEGFTFRVQQYGGYTPPFMTITNGGNVGIGTTSPSSILNLAKDLLNDSTDNSFMINFENTVQGYWDWAIGPAIRNNAAVFCIRGGGDGVSNLNDLFTLHGSGSVGIWTTSPQSYATFAVRDLKWTNRGGDSWTGTYADGNSYQSGGTSNQNYSGYFQYAVYCNQLHTASDRRIKKNIVDINDDTALQKLRLLKPKAYNYINEYQRGSETVFGFIAQEVGEVFPESINVIKEHVPNIYQIGEVLQDSSGVFNIIQFSNFNTNDILRDASGNIYTNLEIVEKSNTSCEVEINSIIDDSKIQVNIDLSDKCLISNDNKNLIFVNGQRVDDFNNLNKSAIWTVATAALQEVDRQLQAEKAKTATLEAEIATLKSKNQTIESQMISILNRLNALENPP